MNQAGEKDPTPSIDWFRFDAMTEEQRHAAAMADPDARPMTEEEWARARPVVHVRLIRYRLRLTQEEFSERFRIPLETLKAWEERRQEPDEVAKAYLRVINLEPEMVYKTLRARPPLRVPEPAK